MTLNDTATTTTTTMRRRRRRRTSARSNCHFCQPYWYNSCLISRNFGILITGCCLINLIASRDLAQQRIGCDSSDHQACDELCKQDSYWYGHCSTWDGRDFSCTCYEYKVPLNGSLCNQMQRVCKEYCVRQGLEGGYCYVYASWRAPNGTTQCKCFEELLPPDR